MVISISFSSPKVLGPDGLISLGPLPPSKNPWQDVVVVDPASGDLWVEIPYSATERRIWKKGKWDLPEIEKKSNYFFRNQLIAAKDQLGQRRRISYDEGGRIKSIFWPNGAKLWVWYDESGKTKRIEGPDSQKWTFDWGNEVTVRSTKGDRYTIRYKEESNNKAIVVKDSSGRQVVTTYVNDVLSSIKGPMGVALNLERSFDKLEVRMDTGRRWLFNFDDTGNVVSYLGPGGEQWLWSRNLDGHLTKIQDPVGRTVKIVTNATGQPVQLDRSGKVLRFRRDANGDLSEVTDVIGVRARIKRDTEGRVVAISDSIGGEVLFKRSHGAISEIIERGGGQWAFERAKSGFLKSIITPTGSVFSFERNQMGEVTKLIGIGQTVFDRDTKGRLSRITDPQNRSFTFTRDVSGDIVSIVRPDRSVVEIKRDTFSDISSVSLGDFSVDITRDISGRVSSIGETEYVRNATGLVSQVNLPSAKSLSLYRDQSGLVNRIEKGSYLLRIERDSLGLPIKWIERGGNVSKVTRDIRGHIVSSGEDIRLVRDSRGWIMSAQSGNLKWQWLRDATGRSLQNTGPESLSLGIERDSSGVIHRLRYPDGSYLAFEKSHNGSLSKWVGDDGVLIEQLMFERNLAGELQRLIEGDKSIYLRRDPLGNVVSVESEGELVWSRSLDGAFDSKGGMVVYDLDGKVQAAQPPQGYPLWGDDVGYFAYFRDKQGRINKFLTEKGVGLFRYDDLDRLTSVCLYQALCWKFSYDPRGMLKSYSPPSGLREVLVWRPDAFTPTFSSGSDLSEHNVLLMSGATRWVQGPLGLMSAMRGDKRHIYVHDLRKRIRWNRTADDTPSFVLQGIGASNIGLSDEVFGDSKRLNLFPGGPVFSGDLAFDPLSMQRLDGQQAFPWGTEQENFRFVDPEIFASQSLWMNPLVLLQQLGELPDFSWVPVEPVGKPVSWLPDSIERMPQYGPSIYDLPIEDDGLVLLYLSLILRGDPDPLPSTIVSGIINAEVGEVEPFRGVLRSSFWWLNTIKEHPNLAYLYTTE